MKSAPALMAHVVHAYPQVFRGDDERSPNWRDGRVLDHLRFDNDADNVETVAFWLLNSRADEAFSAVIMDTEQRQEADEVVDDIIRPQLSLYARFHAVLRTLLRFDCDMKASRVRATWLLLEGMERGLYDAHHVTRYMCYAVTNLRTCVRALFIDPETVEDELYDLEATIATVVHPPVRRCVVVYLAEIAAFLLEQLDAAPGSHEVVAPFLDGVANFVETRACDAEDDVFSVADLRRICDVLHAFYVRMHGLSDSHFANPAFLEARARASSSTQRGGKGGDDGGMSGGMSGGDSAYIRIPTQGNEQVDDVSQPYIQIPTAYPTDDEREQQERSDPDAPTPPDRRETQSESYGMTDMRSNIPWPRHLDKYRKDPGLMQKAVEFTGATTTLIQSWSRFRAEAMYASFESTVEDTEYLTDEKFALAMALQNAIAESVAAHFEEPPEKRSQNRGDLKPYKQFDTKRLRSALRREGTLFAVLVLTRPPAKETFRVFQGTAKTAFKDVAFEGVEEATYTASKRFLEWFLRWMPLRRQESDPDKNAPVDDLYRAEKLQEDEHVIGGDGTGGAGILFLGGKNAYRPHDIDDTIGKLAAYLTSLGKRSGWTAKGSRSKWNVVPLFQVFVRYMTNAPLPKTPHRVLVTVSITLAMMRGGVPVVYRTNDEKADSAPRDEKAYILKRLIEMAEDGAQNMGSEYSKRDIADISRVLDKIHSELGLGLREGATKEKLKRDITAYRERYEREVVNTVSNTADDSDPRTEQITRDARTKKPTFDVVLDAFKEKVRDIGSGVRRLTSTGPSWMSDITSNVESHLRTLRKECDDKEHYVVLEREMLIILRQQIEKAISTDSVPVATGTGPSNQIERERSEGAAPDDYGSDSGAGNPKFGHYTPEKPDMFKNFKAHMDGDHAFTLATWKMMEPRILSYMNDDPEQKQISFYRLRRQFHRASLDELNELMSRVVSFLTKIVRHVKDYRSLLRREEQQKQAKIDLDDEGGGDEGALDEQKQEKQETDAEKDVVRNNIVTSLRAVELALYRLLGYMKHAYEGAFDDEQNECRRSLHADGAAKGKVYAPHVFVGPSRRVPSAVAASSAFREGEEDGEREMPHVYAGPVGRMLSRIPRDGATNPPHFYGGFAEDVTERPFGARFTEPRVLESAIAKRESKKMTQELQDRGNELRRQLEDFIEKSNELRLYTGATGTDTDLDNDLSSKTSADPKQIITGTLNERLESVREFLTTKARDYVRAIEYLREPPSEEERRLIDPAQKAFDESRKKHDALHRGGDKVKPGDNVDMLLGMFKKDVLFLFLFKLQRMFLQLGCLYLAQKVFQDSYVRKVHALKRDPPPLTHMLLTFMSFESMAQLLMLIAVIGASFLFKTPNNTFIIDDGLLMVLLTDFVLTTVAILIVGAIVARVMYVKRYFVYKYHGITTSKAYRDIMVVVVSVCCMLPYTILFRLNSI